MTITIKPLTPYTVPQTVLSNATITSSDYIMLDGNYNALDITINITNAPTGTGSILQFYIQDADPGYSATGIGTSVTSSQFSTTATQTISLTHSYSGLTKLSWAVNGTNAKFTGVYVTITPTGSGILNTRKQLIKTNSSILSGGSSIVNVSTVEREIDIFINASGIVNGFNPTLQLLVSSIDPGDGNTVTGLITSGSIISTTSAQTITIINENYTLLRLDWVVTGLNAQFNGVFITVVSKTFASVGISGGPGSAFTPGGDLSGTSTSQTVSKLQGSTLAAPSSSGSANKVLHGDSSGTLHWSQVDLTSDVIGALPSGNQSAQSMGGDVSGTTTAATVTKIQGNAIKAEIEGASHDGYVLTWANSNSRWEAKSTGSGFTAGGDLSGTSINQTVIKINGSSVPIGGALTTGNILQVNGASSLTYAAINLGGGVGYVTGTLPAGNQAAQSMSGDVTGTTAASTVVALRGKGLDISLASLGALQDGYVLEWINVSSDWQAKPLPTTLPPSGTAGGDLSNTYPNPTVAKINGTTITTAGGALTTGRVLRVTGVSSVDYGAVDLANANAITGVLPVANQASQTMAGDVTGTTAASTVAKINATTVTTAGGALVTGKVLRVTGASSADYGAVDLANANAVTGTLPAGNQASQTMGGDASGTTAAATVIALRGKSLDATLASVGASQDGYLLTWVNVSNDWQAKPNSFIGAVTLAGDVTGASNANTVVNIHGASVPVAGALTTGNVLQVNGASSLTYAAINLAGGVNYVTGTLPAANQVSQTMGGDVTGTTAASTVAKINATTVTTAGGALTTGRVLRVTGVATSDWGAIDLANANAVTGILPTANQAAQAMSGDVTGTTAASTVAKINATTVTTAGGSLVTGKVLRVTGISSVDYGAVDLANVNAVIGILPTGNQASQTVGGDLSGTTAAATVTALRGKSLDASLATVGASQDGYLLTWINSANDWQAKPDSFTGVVTLAGDVTGASNANTVAKINGTTVTTAGGALTTGRVLRVTGVSSVDYGAVDLANANAVTGILPTANQAAQTMGGDVTGTTAASTVAKVNGAIVPASGALTTGNVLQVNGVSSLTYGAINLAGGANYVTGTLPAANQAAQTMGGDVTGTTTASTVAKINATTVTTAGGALTTGRVLRVTGVATSDWGSVDLANANAVTGVLPVANQASQTMAGDVTGTTAASTVAKINGATVPVSGALTTGNVLQVNGASSLTYAAINLAGGANYVTGVLPAANQAAQTLSGNVTGTTSASVVSAISGISPIAITPAELQFTVGTVLPKIDQADLTTVSGTGQTLTIQAQNETGTTSTGGALHLSSGTGTTIAGNLILQTGGASQITISQGAGAPSITMVPNTLQFEQTVTSPLITQGDLNAVSGTGQTLTIRAQNETGTTSTGGDLVLTTGTGTSNPGNLHLQTGGVDQIALTQISGSITINITPQTIQWVTATTSPVITQASSTASGQNMMIQAQSTTGAGTNGGNLILASGNTVTGADGQVTMRIGGVDQVIASQVRFRSFLPTTIGLTTGSNFYIGSNTYTTRLVNSALTPFTIDTSTMDDTLDVDTSGGAISVTLPTPSNGRKLLLRDITGTFSTNNCTLSPSSTEKINGIAVNKILSAAWGSWTITSNGIDWFVG